MQTSAIKLKTLMKWQSPKLRAVSIAEITRQDTNTAADDACAPGNIPGGSCP
jgi:hypothetical protein